MANSTDKSILTAAGKALLAQLNAEEKALVIDKMIFANVPNRPEYPQPDDVVPTDHIVHQEQVEQRGRLSADSVIYSTTLTSDVGPFDFNWTGAYCSEYGVLVTIDHHALTPKTADEPGVAGNTLVRSVVLEYKDIAEITNITVDASSWQYNATERMKKMDSDVAQSIIDQNGKDWFIEDGFLVTPSGSAYSIKAGAGYVSGNRVAMEFDRSVQVPNKPSFIYIDAHREGTPTGEQVTLFNFVVTAEEKDDYIDYSTGKDVKHFVCKIAQVLADGSVSDLRLKSLMSPRWEKGKVITDPTEKYIYQGIDREADSRRYFAPSASKDYPVLMGDTPIGDSKFVEWDSVSSQTGFDLLRSTNVGSILKKFHDSVEIDGVVFPLSKQVNGQIKEINITAKPYYLKTSSETVYLLDIKYYRRGVATARAFWAASGGDDSACLQSAHDSSKTVFYQVARYKPTRPINYGQGTTIVGEGFANRFSSGKATFAIERDTWDGSSALFTREDNTVQVQSVAVINVGFIAYANIDPFLLAAAEDINVSAFDASTIRDGLTFMCCSFQQFGTAVKELYRGTGYLGKVDFSHCDFYRCYRATDLASTTGVGMSHCKVYECYDWLVGSKYSLLDVSFNNSSHSQDNCSIHASVIEAIGCWFEGGNRWLNSSLIAETKRISWSLSGCTISEAFASEGYLKFIAGIKPGDNVNLVIKGSKLPENTRIFDRFLAGNELKNANLELYACENISNLWGRDSASLSQYANSGLSYRGKSNTLRSGYVEPLINSTVDLANNAYYSQAASTSGYKIGASSSLDIALTALSQQTSTAEDPHFVQFLIIGQNSGEGGTAVYKTEFTLARGYGSKWVLWDKDGDGGTGSTSIATSVADVSISDETQNSCKLNITTTHGGNKSATKLYAVYKSAGVQLPMAFL